MELIDLTKILKVGDSVYCAISGCMKEVLGINTSISPYCIKTRSGLFTKFGQYLTDGECLLFPSKDQRDWQKYIDSKKVKLFTTEDGVDIFEGDDCFVCYKSDLRVEKLIHGFTTSALLLWYFSTKEAAEKFADQERTNRLIEEAKKRYPVGCKVKSAYREYSTYTVESDKFYEYRDVSLHITSGSRFGFSVYYNGKWAEIVSSPHIQKSNDTPTPFTKEQTEWIENKIKEVVKLK